METIVTTTEDMKRYGEAMANTLTPGVVVCLHGDLGAGKTTLVKGVAQALGIKNEITSPTFTLMNVHEINKKQLAISKLVHIDTYRLNNENDLIEIGAEDYVGRQNTVTFVEWPEKIPSLLQNKKVINIYIDHLENSGRKITTE